MTEVAERLDAPAPVERIAGLLALEDEDPKGESETQESEETQDSTEETTEETSEAETDQEEVEAEADTEEESEEESEDAEEDGIVLVGDDAVVEVDGKQLTVAELKRNGLFQADYTRKTQSLADERREFEAEQASVRDERQKYGERLEALEEYLGAGLEEEPDWEKVKAEKPDEYPTLYADYQRRNNQLTKVRQERGKVSERVVEDQQKALGEYLSSQRNALLEVLPEWRDEAKQAAEQKELVEYGKTLGFSDEELGTLYDHRAVLVLRNAMLHDRLQRTKSTVREKVKKAPVLKPGAKQPKKAKPSRKLSARKRLAESGKPDDAAALIFQYLEEEES